SYFDQINIFLFLVIAMISVLEYCRRDVEFREKGGEQATGLDCHGRQDTSINPYFSSSRRESAGVSHRAGALVPSPTLSTIHGINVGLKCRKVFYPQAIGSSICKSSPSEDFDER